MWVLLRQPAILILPARDDIERAAGPQHGIPHDRLGQLVHPLRRDGQERARRDLFHLAVATIQRCHATRLAPDLFQECTCAQGELAAGAADHPIGAVAARLDHDGMPIDPRAGRADRDPTGARR